MKIFKYISAFTLSLFLWQCTVFNDKPSVIPVENFFKNPQKTAFQLSPDGENISYLAPFQNRMNIFVRNMKDTNAIMLTHSEEFDIRKYRWANDKTLLYFEYYPDNSMKFYSIDIASGDTRALISKKKVNIEIVDIIPEIENKILVAADLERKGLMNVYDLDIYTGKAELREKNPGKITHWMTDHNHKVRLAFSTDNVNQVILFRNSENDPFKVVASTNFRQHLKPLIFTFDNKYVYASSNLGRDKAAIVKYDLWNNKEIEVIYENPEVDVFDLMYSPKDKEVGAVYFNTWKLEYKFFNPDWEKFFTGLMKKFKGYQVTVPSRSKDETRYLIRTFSDKSYGAYYYYDISNDRFEKLSDVNPWLKEDELSDMKPIWYKSRDGLTIQGYLTIPKGEDAKNLPVVVYPHGGPWLRDTWTFRPDVQFLANRGYAVLQMNYRGSVEFGRKFYEAGFKQWGQKMQNDITDGVDWLIEQGIADKDKIAIYGYSFGGYAALTGLAFTPEYYRCGVSIAGLADIKTFLGTIPPRWKPFREMLYELVGHPKHDSEMLEKYSPINHADKIKAPVFIAYGKLDKMIDPAQMENFISELKRNKADVTVMYKEDEGHGFSKEENRLELYRKIEKFLAKNLGGRAE